MRLKNKPIYVNTTAASIAFVLFLTFGFIWTSFHEEAPFTAYMEGLVLALGFITGKRLWQTWRGNDKSFTNRDNSQNIPIK